MVHKVQGPSASSAFQEQPASPPASPALRKLANKVGKVAATAFRS